MAYTMCYTIVLNAAMSRDVDPREGRWKEELEREEARGMMARMDSDSKTG